MKISPSLLAFVSMFIGLMLFSGLLKSFQTPVSEVPTGQWLTLLIAMLLSGAGVYLEERKENRSRTFGLVTAALGVLIVVASFVLEYSGLGWSGTTLITLGMTATASIGALFVLFGLWALQRRRHRVVDASR